MIMLDEINDYRKEYVFENYNRIVKEFKDYEKISRKKMLQEIYDVYSDYNNIIDICTTKELKLLKMIIDNNENHMDSRYNWERSTLRDKFIIKHNFISGMEIPEEIRENVVKAVKNVNWKEAKKKDGINETLVSICEMNGSMLIDILIEIGSALLEKSKEEIAKHIFKNKVFNYYVCLIEREESDNIKFPIAIYNDYYCCLEELEYERSIQGKAVTKIYEIEDYKALFYNDFNINNPKIKKFDKALKELPFFYNSAIPAIKQSALLNRDRDALKEAIQNVPILSERDLTDFFKLMDEAMDEMPSGALNGITPNQLKEYEKEELEFETRKKQKYVPQKNAHLTKKDIKLFYKLYFGLLEFTNQKYKIKPNYKIYQKKGINPYNLIDIVDKFWEEKDVIILEFSLANPFKFNQEELKIVQEFKKGFRDMFVIVQYEEEYTAIMNESKVYMIKGVTSNIDQIVPYKKLPHMVITSILPFKNQLIYDGIFMSSEINFGLDFQRAIEKEYENSLKYYHL